MSNVIFAPNSYDAIEDLTIGLFGSIEQGKAEEWQDKIIKIFSEVPYVTFLNPRRLDWDASWAEDSPEMVEQIQWEQRVLHDCDLAIFYFDPSTKSPITLMELGEKLVLSPRETLVCCPEGYWRRTNVRVTSEFHGVDMLSTFDDLVTKLAEKLLEDPEKAYTYLPLDKRSANLLYEWAESQKIPNIIPREQLHCTVVYSKASELPDYELLSYGTVAYPPYHLDGFKDALVLRFEHEDATAQWTKAKEMGSEPDFENYAPHVSLSYDCDGFDFSDLELPKFPITFDPEVRGT